MGEIAEVSAGNSAPQNSAFFENGIYPFCRTSDVGRVHHSINFYQIQDKLNDIGIKGLRLFKKETILLPKSGASTLLNHRVMLTIDSYVSSHLATIYRNEKIVLAKYLFYFLSQFDVNELIPDKSYPSLKVTEIAKIKIPIPPLETQQKIVKILDKFTELEATLEATLEAELALRKRQYRYYRDFLLDFDNQIGGRIADSYKGRLKDVVWKTLGEVSDIKVGKSPETNEIGNYPFINAGTIPSGYIASYNTEPDTITTPSRGQGGIGYVGYQASKFWCGPLCYRVRSNNNLIMTKFLYYVMSKDMSKIINLANMAGIPALNKKDLVNFLIPIPPLAEQEKIVAILDKFDTLTHSISEGLPYEIALRRKQYEYYREQLLAFPKAA